MLKNNVIWSEGTALYADADFDEGYNVFWATGGAPDISGGVTLAPSSKMADPLFVDPPSGEFRLLASSPARDAGTTESLLAGFETDMAGVAVPSGSGVDIGAYEFVAG